MGRVRQESKKEQIHEKIWETLEEKKERIHYSDLVKVLSEKLLGINKNTIHCALHSFRTKFVMSENSKVLNPDMGFYILKKYY